MEKRLFYRDPSTGEETPLLVYQVDTNAVSALLVGKQDKTDANLDTSVKTVVGAINELNTKSENALYEPYTAGTDGQVLTSDGDGGYAWENTVSDVSLQYDETEQELLLVVTK